MKKQIIQCDRCGHEAHKTHVLTLDDRTMDLCNSCYEPLRSWLSKDNATIQGDMGRPKQLRGPGWREVCPHRIPCAGPCPTPSYTRT